jgi:hypothetical protein
MASQTNRRTGARGHSERATLPERYRVEWEQPFNDAVTRSMRDGSRVLDIGSGRNPTVLPADRPPNTHYVGLDMSADELDAAGAGAYDQVRVADVGRLQDDFVGRFDLAVSWQVLEHVEDLGATMVCIRSYLAEGGKFIAMFSGSRSAFALINRIVPSGLGAPIVTRVMNRSPERNPVFPAYYDRCTASSLQHLLADWSDVHVQPFYRGAGYFQFSSALMKAYLRAENYLERSGRPDTATHYLLIASR